jgi:hypothetical protein
MTDSPKPEEPPVGAVQNIPRRARLDLNTTTELRIRSAIDAVESLGMHPALTDIVVGLSALLDKTAAYLEAVECGEPWCKGTIGNGRTGPATPPPASEPRGPALSEAILAIECPHCRAKPGVACQPVSPGSSGGIVCTLRIKAARSATPKPQPPVAPAQPTSELWRDVAYCCDCDEEMVCRNQGVGMTKEHYERVIARAKAEGRAKGLREAAALLQAEAGGGSRKKAWLSAAGLVSRLASQPGGERP